MFSIGKAKSNSTKYTIGTTLSCIILHADTDYFCRFSRNFYFFMYALISILIFTLLQLYRYHESHGLILIRFIYGLI